MVDVDKLSDAELRTKLLEFGFPMMPITGTTRKVMAKKLKLLLENKNKVGASDGRRSLGRYSSEEESDTDVKIKKDRNRRVTMAAPVSSTTKTVRRTVIEPEVVNNSPKKRENRITTSTTTTRSQKIIKSAQDEFDTGSDSESDVIVSSNKYQPNRSNPPSKYEDSYEDEVEFQKRSSPIKSTLSSSYSRYSPPKSDDFNYSGARNASFNATSSPSRYTSLSGSVASDYAADKLNQIRSRLSLNNSGYDRPTSYSSYTTNNVQLEEKDTPFLSNFTKRLSTLSASKKVDYDNRNDMVKEHDTNGSSLYGKSYLSNFKSARSRESVYDYKARETSGKSNYISFAVLAGAALFFLFLALIYLGMRSDTSVVTTGYISPLCVINDLQSKRGVNCIEEEEIRNAVNLLNSIKPELHKRSIAHRCFDSTIKPQMTETDIIAFCQMNYGIKDAGMIKNDLRNLEIMIFSNPEWGISVAQTEKNDGTVTDENISKNMEQVVFNRGIKVTSLVVLNPDLPYRCTIYNTLANALFATMLIGFIFGGLYVFVLAFKFYRKYEQKQKDEVNNMVERIIDILQSAAADESRENYVVINHVRDMILNVKERKDKQNCWEKAVKYINENESRVRSEVQTVQGEPFDVWRWIGSANLSVSNDDTTDYKYRPGRRIVDVEYIINQTLQFPHKMFFFCQSKDVQIKNEVREGFFSVYLLRCKRCLKEHSVCSEEPKTELLDVNLAFVAGIVSLGLNLYQLNELCSSIHIPTVSGHNFNRYLEEIHDIYRESKIESEDSGFTSGELLSSTRSDNSENSKSSDRLFSAIDELESSIVPLDFEAKKASFLKELERDIDKIEVLTKDQSSEELWFRERRKRLTASNFGRICKLLDKTNRASVVKNLLFATFKGNIYTQYGKDNEDNAIEQFEKVTGKKVVKSGLVVHRDYPFLAASPDGTIIEENALVEIKCPYKARGSTINEAFVNKEIQFATYTDGALTLKREDKYFYQVQGQLHITGKSYCYFVVWTPKGMAFEIIYKDQDYWDKMFPKLEEFYFSYLLPEIIKLT